MPEEVVEDSSETHAEKDEFDKMANRRASLEEKYQDALENVREENTDYSKENEDTSVFSRLTWNNVRGWVLDRVDLLDERINQSLYTISDVETHPPMDETSLDDALKSAEGVESIRFVFENGDKSQWYTWNVGESEHPLNYIIDYYTENKSISGLFGKTVRGKTPCSDSSDEQYLHILYPEHYEKKSSHIKFKLYSILDMLLEDEDSDKETMGYYFSSSTYRTDPEGFHSPISNGYFIRNFLSNRFLNLSMASIWSVSLGSVGYLITSWAINSVDSVMKNLMPSINIPKNFVVPLLCVLVIGPMMIQLAIEQWSHNNPDDEMALAGVLVAIGVCLFPLTFLVGSLFIAYKIGSSYLSEVNQYNPHTKLE